jgi:thiol-disulfide isomerase/thioredoxin
MAAPRARRARSAGGPRRHEGRGPIGRAKGWLSVPARRGEGWRIAAAFLVAGVALAAVPHIGAAPAPVPEGGAPAFMIDVASGGSYSLSSDLGVRPLLVEFMHPDCSHCRAMGPVLATAHGEFGSRVAFVSVGIQLGATAAPTGGSLSAFAAEFGHTWIYGADRGTAARDAYRIGGTPTFAFIDASGALLRVVPGEMSIGDLRGELAALAGG